LTIPIGTVKSDLQNSPHVSRTYPKSEKKLCGFWIRRHVCHLPS